MVMKLNTEIHNETLNGFQYYKLIPFAQNVYLYVELVKEKYNKKIFSYILWSVEMIIIKL